ncbi:Frizzled 8c [Fasciolopsis buskii]|uniref:Frizzled 8c n=1 Tax=Fasciolopsis buskii TaxID=27845 RepID=A0A8E0S4I7_9TREM|nr:Frizzled 8c [Fasciolopsis buski]
MRYTMINGTPSHRRCGLFVFFLYITAVINRACVGYSSLTTQKQHQQQSKSNPESNSHKLAQPVGTTMSDSQEFGDGSQWHPVPFHEVLGTHLDSKTHRCEPVKLALCKGMYYPNTRMPNMFHHETQEEAGLEAHQFYPLVQINCSEDLRFLLCSIYTPICIESYPSFLPPCRSICERVKAGCAPIMQHYNFPWPDRMSCDQFPEYNNPDGVLCMERNLTEHVSQPAAGKKIEVGRKTPVSADIHPKLATEQIRPTETGNKWLEKLNVEASQKLLKQAVQNRTVRNWIRTDPGIRLACQCKCMPTARDTNQESNEERDSTYRDCSLPCRSLHSGEDLPDGFTTYWLALWSTLCAISTLLTILTFMLDSYRFQYPELSIIYLSTCYFMISIGYIIRLIVGHESVSCDNTATILTSSVSTTSATITGDSKLETGYSSLLATVTTVAQDMTASSHFDRIKVLRYANSGRASCAIVFLLVYFFGMASFVWWVILTFTWFLAAGLKWGSEAISRYSQVFHFIAWSIPTAITALALLLSVVEGDPASGLCTIGTTRPLAQILFLFTPSLVFLSVGVIFLLAGFVALFRIRGVIKLQRIGMTKTDRLETLMLRIGIFGALYTIPNVTVLVCMGYELRNSHMWQLGQMCRCAYETTKVGVPDRALNPLPEWIPPRPDYIMFLVKHFMSLIIGVTSGFWIWSHKTLNSWRLLCRGRCCSVGVGRSSHSGTVRLLTTTTNAADPDVSSKQNVVPWSALPSAVSTRSTNIHSGNVIDLHENRTKPSRCSVQNSHRIFGQEQKINTNTINSYPVAMPLPPVPPGNEAYFYDRINQNVTTPSMIDQRVLKGYSVQSDGSQTLLSPYTDTSDNRTADGSTGTDFSVQNCHPISGPNQNIKQPHTTDYQSYYSSASVNPESTRTSRAGGTETTLPTSYVHSNSSKDSHQTGRSADSARLRQRSVSNGNQFRSTPTSTDRSGAAHQPGILKV